MKKGNSEFEKWFRLGNSIKVANLAANIKNTVIYEDKYICILRPFIIVQCLWWP